MALLTLSPLSTGRWPALLALLLVGANVSYNYLRPPLGLLGSPVAAAVACAIGLAGTAAWSPYARARLCAGLLMVQDLGMKLFGGGLDDRGWQATCNLLLVVAALVSLGVLAVVLGRSRQYATQHKLGGGGLFVALLVGYLLLCAGLGLGHAIGLYLD